VDADKVTELSVLAATGGGVLPQVNMADMKDHVSDQIRAFLLNMMPKQAFDQVIGVAWRGLTEPRPEVRDKYNNVKHPERPSELEEMITTEMREQMKQRVAEWAIEWKVTPACDLGAKTMFTELVDLAAGKFVHFVAAQIVGEAASALAANATAVGSCQSCNSVCIKGAQCNCGNWN